MTDINMDKIGTNIKLLRCSRGLTQEEMSDELFLARTTYSSYETGLKIPDLRTLDSLSNYHNVSFASIFEKDLTEKPLHNVYFGFSTESIRKVLTNYESLSFASKRLVMEKLTTLLERENMFYKDCNPDDCRPAKFNKKEIFIESCAVKDRISHHDIPEYE